MTRVQLLEDEVRKLNRIGLAAFRDWFLEYDSGVWDRKIEKHVRSGKLASLARKAIAAHHACKTKEL